MNFDFSILTPCISESNILSKHVSFNRLLLNHRIFTCSVTHSEWDTLYIFDKFWNMCSMKFWYQCLY